MDEGDMNVSWKGIPFNESFNVTGSAAPFTVRKE
jgi:hypothetical protein